jgi:tRNA(Ile)-lysidine synthase
VERQSGLLTLGPAGRAGRASPQAGAAALSPIIWRWRATPACALPGDLGQIELRVDAHGPLNLAALGARLTVRWRRGGERLAIAPGGSRRALKSLLRESRLAPAQRARLPLVYSGARLVAVADLWLDASVQAGPRTARRARFVWSPPPGTSA